MTIARWLNVGVLSLLVSGSVACGGMSGEPSEQDVSQTSAALTGAYAIRFNSNLGCLHDPGNGALALDGCSYANDDKWRFSPNSPGFFVQPYFSSPCITTWNQSTNQMPLKLQSCGAPDSVNQARWRLLGRSGLPDGPGYPYFKLQNVATLRCMTAHPSGSTWTITEETCNWTIDPNNGNDGQVLWLDTFNN
jgi:hypothetical protein